MAPSIEHAGSKASDPRRINSTGRQASLSRDEVIVPIDEDEELDSNADHLQSKSEEDFSPKFAFSVQEEIKHKAAPSASVNPFKSRCVKAVHNSIASSHKKKRRSQNLPKSFDFGVKSDPPTQLIENFLQRQAASGNLCLDMDLDMMEKLPHTLAGDNIYEDVISLKTNPNPIFSSNLTENVASAETNSTPPSIINPSSEAVTGLRSDHGSQQCVASFKPTHSAESSQGNYKSSISFSNVNPSKGASDNENLEESLAHTDDYVSDSSGDEDHTRYKSSLPALRRLQTRSRLADPPPLVQQVDANKPGYKSTKLRSGPVRSGLIQNSSILGKLDEEEDDPLKDSDMPDSFRKHRWSPLIVFQWISFFLVMAGLICSLTVPALKQRPLWSMALWKWAFLVFLLFCGRLVSGWAIKILVIIIERNFLLRKRVLYFVYGLRKGVQNFLWFAFAILAWRVVFDPKLEKTTNSKVLPLVTKVLHCFLIAAAIWLVKIFFVKVLASSFHVSTYFERIRESLFGQWVLETLSGPPVIEIEQEAKVIEELNDLRKAGAKIPEAMMPKTRLEGGEGPYNSTANQNDIMGANANTNGIIQANLDKGKVIGGKSINMRVGEMPRSGVMGGNGKSGFIGKSGLLRVKSQHFKEKMSAPEETINIDDLQRLNQRNISAWNMKRLMNFVRYRGIYTLAHVIDQSAAESQADIESQDVEIESEWQAKSVARRIFKNVAKTGSRFIVKDDLMRFMREAEVEKAIALFEGAMETGKITKNALKDFAVHVVRERRALSLSLNDTKTAVKKLHTLVDVIVGVVIVIICMLVLGFATTHFLLLISSQLVLVVFIFGNTCKNVFEAIVFLFVVHPFDVGDRCVVDGNQVVVEEMNILSTLFMRNDGEKLWYPNSILATKYIFNYYRTPDTGDTFDFCIDSCTPAEKITALKEKIGRYIASKPNLWARDYTLIVKEIENNNKMKMQLMFNHTINFSDSLERQMRRSDLILEVKKMLQELDVGYHLPIQEVRLGNSSEIRHRPLGSDFGDSKTHLKAV